MLLSWTYKYNPPTTKEVVDFNLGGSESKHKRQLRHRHTSRVKKKKTIEISIEAGATLAQQQLQNQKDGKKGM
jgi:hypothetical protein